MVGQHHVCYSAAEASTPVLRFCILSTVAYAPLFTYLQDMLQVLEIRISLWGCGMGKFGGEGFRELGEIRDVVRVPCPRIPTGQTAAPVHEHLRRRRCNAMVQAHGPFWARARLQRTAHESVGVPTRWRCINDVNQAAHGRGTRGQDLVGVQSLSWSGW
jgi:hypothetical protein